MAISESVEHVTECVAIGSLESEVHMTFHPLEIDTIDDYSGVRELGPEWTESPLHELVLAASSTKSAFARHVVASLATEAGVDFAGVPGRTGGRRKVGRMAVEIKFSTELPARFQQVRPPDDGYTGGVEPATFGAAAETRSLRAEGRGEICSLIVPQPASRANITTCETVHCRHFVEGERRDLNPRPPGPQPGALPTELRPPRETGV
jgi:hypothetical protein